jgi:probable rRNA maturation factor
VVSKPKLPYKDIKVWIKQILANSNLKVGEISIIFCDDNYLLNINKKFLNHNYFTDIITFNYNSENILSGDIFISSDTVLSNANFYSVSEQSEYLRVIIHGILHLIGFNDHTVEEKELMVEKENESLIIFRDLFESN